MDSELLDVVQEHVDAAYTCNGDINSDGIDWALAERTAHEHLDKFVGFEAVQNAINYFKH